MKLKNVFVTGANGFVGQVVVKILSKQYTVWALIRPGSMPRFELNDNVRVVYGDLTDKKSLEKVIPHKAVVINLAANPYHPKLSYKVNVKGLQNLIEVAIANKTDRFIQMSSQATKIKKQGVYAKTKNIADNIVKRSGLNYVILKPSLIYGVGERGLFATISKLMKTLPVVPIFGDGKTKINPILVEDVAHYLSLIVKDNQISNKVWELGSKYPITYNKLYNAIAGNQKVKFIHVPSLVGLTLAYLIRFIKHPPISPDNVLGSTQETNCKPNKIISRYRYSPVEFDEGIKKIRGENQIKVAVVGLGKMGTLHLSLLATFPQVRVVALVDTNPALFSTVKSMGVSGNYYQSLTAAIKYERLDAVYLITPTFTHLPLIKEALVAGLNIFVEKPLALNMRELSELRKIKTKKIIHVGYTLLYAKVFTEIKRILERKKYGRILSVEGSFAHGEVFGDKQGWMFNKELSGGGVLMNPGPHFFSVLNLLFGKGKVISSTIRELYKKGLDDEATAIIEYNDFKAKINLSWSVSGKLMPENKFKIICSKGTIVTDGHQIVIQTLTNKFRIKENQINDSEKKIFNLNPEAYGEAYFLENKYFLEAIRGGKTVTLNTLKNAIEAESTIHEVYKRATMT